MRIENILLLRPPLLYHKTIGHEEPHPPLELAYLGGALENDCRVKIIDAFAQGSHIESFHGETLRCGMNDQELIEIINREAPEVVGISGMWVNQQAMVSHMAHLVKRVNPGIVTVIGGNLASAIPGIMLQNPDIDYCVVGEGEDSFKGLVGQIRRSGLKERSKVKGVAHRFNQETVFNGQAVVYDLDSLAMPAYHLLDPDIYDAGFKLGRVNSPRFMGILASRGCTHTCNFCCLPNVGGRVFRHHSIARIITEIQGLKSKHGIQEVQFYDSNLLNDSSFAKSLFRQMQRSKINLPWVAIAGLSPWEIDDELLELAAASGMYRLDLPLESANAETKDKIMGKGVFKEVDIKRIICKARSLGVKKIYAYIIVGSPGENKRSIKESLYLLNEVDADVRVVKYAQPFPGTGFYETCCRNKYLAPGFSYDRLWFALPNLRTQEFSEKYLFSLVQADRMHSLARRKIRSVFSLIVDVFIRFGARAAIESLLLVPYLIFKYRKLGFKRTAAYK